MGIHWRSGMASSLPIRHVRFLSTLGGAAAAATSSAAAATASVSKSKASPLADFNPFKSPGIFSSIADRPTSMGSSRYPPELSEKSLQGSQRVAEIENLIESHKKDPRVAQEPYLSGLIHCYGLAGMFEHALKTYCQMEELGTPRSVMSFNALLSACYLSKQFDRMPNLFSEFPNKFNFVPDETSYALLAKSFCKLGWTDRAIEALWEMEDKKVPVTAVTFTPILDALYKKGDREGADKLWKAMESKGYSPDVAAYNVKLMHAGGEHLGTVEALIEEMKGAGLKPDTVSYNHLMTCYSKLGMTDEAMKVYEGLEDNGCRPNLETFRALTLHLCDIGKFEEGYRVFKKGVEQHKLPQFSTMRDLLDGLVKVTKTEEARELIQMVKKEFPSNFLNYWKGLEEQLGLASTGNDATAAGETEEATVSTSGESQEASVSTPSESKEAAVAASCETEEAAVSGKSETQVTDV